MCPFIRKTNLRDIKCSSWLNVDLFKLSFNADNNVQFIIHLQKTKGFCSSCCKVFKVVQILSETDNLKELVKYIFLMFFFLPRNYRLLTYFRLLLLLLRKRLKIANYFPTNPLPFPKIVEDSQARSDEFSIIFNYKLP